MAWKLPNPVSKEAGVRKRPTRLRKQVGSYELLSLAAVLAFTASSSARAEGGRSSLGARLRSTLSFDVSGGGTTSLFGGVAEPGRGTLELALHARLPLLVRSGLDLDYIAGVVPVAFAFGTRVSGAGVPDGTLRTETAFGAGVDGAGLVARFGSSDRWQPYVGAVGGVRFFERPVPDPRGTRFNFSADLGAGVALRTVGVGRWCERGSRRGLL